MKIRYNSRLLVISGLIFFQAAVGYALEHRDARSSARVNLRRSPSLSSEILGTIPNGHKVKILQENGLWWKVEVRGDINGTGWAFARYLEKIIRAVPEKEYSVQSMTVKNTSAAQKFELHRIEPQSDFRTETAGVKSLPVPEMAKYLATSLKEQASVTHDLKNPGNELIDGSGGEAPPVVESDHMPSAQLPYYRFNHEAPEITGKDASAQVEPPDSIDSPGSTPDEQTNPVEIVHKTVPADGEPPPSYPRAMASSVQKPPDSHPTKDLTVKQQPIGPLALALKMVSIVLYGLVILLLYKGD